MKGIGRAVLGVAPALLHCGGGGSGGGPAQPSSPSCRTYASQQSLTVTTSSVAGVPPVQVSGAVSCSFDRVSATLTCNSTLTIAGSSCISTSVNSSVYLTVDDFVDEGALLGRQLLMRSAASGTTSVPGVDGGCVSVPSPPTTLNYTYDGQRRPTSSSDSTGNGTTFTAWDSNGRATRGTVNTPACRSQPFSISYDDSARMTVFSYEPGGIGTCILLTTSASYDAAGLLIRARR